MIFGVGEKTLKDPDRVWPAEEWWGGHTSIAEDRSRLNHEEKTFQRRERSCILELVPQEKEFLRSLRKFRQKNVCW